MHEQFLLSGGPIEWLTFGLESVDPKLKRIAELNEMIAFKPWAVTKDTLAFLIKGGQNQNENWTIHEVLKASMILTGYHGLCGLTHGMGLTPDIDIIQELYTLMGPQALELAVSKETLNKRGMSKHYTSTDCEADVSSYNSRS